MNNIQMYICMYIYNEKYCWGNESIIIKRNSGQQNSYKREKETQRESDREIDGQSQTYSVNF